jgi:hypothetical protein
VHFTQHIVHEATALQVENEHHMLERDGEQRLKVSIIPIFATHGRNFAVEEDVDGRQHTEHRESD